MAKDSKSSNSWTGLGDSRPSSSPKEKPNQGGFSPTGVSDFRGEMDSRPSSSPKSTQKIPTGGKG